METPAEAGLPRYNQCLRRIPFWFHTLGRASLASRGDLAALQKLFEDYRKPAKAPAKGMQAEDHARYTLATLFAQYFDDRVSVDHLTRFRQEFATPADAWLWFKVLGVEAHQHGLAPLVEVVRKHPSPYLRAAALVALVGHGDLEAAAAVPDICAALPKQPGERRLMLGAVSQVIAAAAPKLKTPAMQAALRAYIGLLAKDRRLTLGERSLIARHLGPVFGSSARHLDPEPWLHMLETGREPPKTSGGTVTQLRFFGIEAAGDRICYVIDMSNSMCTPVAPRGPTTGPRKKRRKGPPDETDIPWHLVKNRFDLAREHLKISLLRLTKGQHFCVIWFGSEAGTLTSCPGLLPATPGNVRKVIKELDSIAPLSPEPPDAPDGRLRGNTNMHGGLRLAFALHSRGPVKRFEHVDPKVFVGGCDSVFLLSDGAPSFDSFAVEDQFYANEIKVVADQESGREISRRERIVYHGPYHESPWFDDDLRRMNLFRRVPIHCIAIGEADVPLLRRIAAESGGQVYVFEDKTPSRGR